MKVAIKYIILALGIIAGIYAIKENNIAAGLTAAGALIAFALVEVEDLRIINKED